jgi:2-(1,2-epoxy-1,2-dihydrophenyl)acetyl-CoA isomerase
MTNAPLDGGNAIARIILDRPEDGNSIDLAAARAFEEDVKSAIRGGRRVLVLSARGRVFCGGGDVRAMSGAADPAGYTRELADTLHRALLAIAESDLIFLCAVQGAAAGAGFGIVLNADYVVASQRATFVTAYLALGVTPDAGTSYLLPRVAGLRRSTELTLTGRRLDAATACEWGLGNEVVSDDALGGRVDEVARTFADAPLTAVSATKRLLGLSWLPGYREHLAKEASSIAEHIRGAESRELQAAFLNR